MRAAELESWVLQIAQRVADGKPVEDQRVELKGATWPEPAKAARRIAAHANSARADFVLWIVGIDERTGVAGANDMELSTWWPQVQSQFDQLPPDLLLHLNVPIGDKVVVALLIDAERRPYVVKNPKAGEAIDREVPWREGTLVRTARRSELMNILAPFVRIPRFETVFARVAQHLHQHQNQYYVVAEIRLYVVASERIVLRPRRCTAAIRHGEDDLEIPYEMYFISDEPLMIRRSGRDIVIDGPGALALRFNRGSAPLPWERVRPEIVATAFRC